MTMMVKSNLGQTREMEMSHCGKEGKNRILFLKCTLNYQITLSPCYTKGGQCGSSECVRGFPSICLPKWPSLDRSLDEWLDKDTRGHNLSCSIKHREVAMILLKDGALLREAILYQIGCFFTHCVNGPCPPPPPSFYTIMLWIFQHKF